MGRMTRIAAETRFQGIALLSRGATVLPCGSSVYMTGHGNLDQQVEKPASFLW